MPLSGHIDGLKSCYSSRHEEANCRLPFVVGLCKSRVRGGQASPSSSAPPSPPRLSSFFNNGSGAHMAPKAKCFGAIFYSRLFSHSYILILFANDLPF